MPKRERGARVAGVLQAPPALVEAISSWVQSTVAATELQQRERGFDILKREVANRKTSPLVRKIKEVRQAIADGLGVRALYALFADEQTGLFTMAWDEAKEAAGDAFRGQIGRLKGFKDFSAQYKQGNRWLLAALDVLDGWVKGQDDWTTQAFEGIEETIRKLKSYIVPGANHPMSQGSATRVFEITKYMKGWKYESLLSDPGKINKSRELQLQKKLRELEQLWARRLHMRKQQHAPPPDEIDTRGVNEYREYYKAEIDKAKSHQYKLAFTNITVKAYTHQDDRARATWNSQQKEIQIFYPVSTDAWGMSGLAGSVEHELQHMTQTLIQETFDVPTAGLPKGETLTPNFLQWMNQTEEWMGKNPYLKKLRDKAMQQLDEEGVIEQDVGWGRKYRIPPQKIDFHALDDREFFTRLNDDIRTARRMMSGLNGDVRDNAIDLYTYVIPIPDSHDRGWHEKVTELGGWDALSSVLQSPSRFLGALKKVPSARGKYVRAVKEFRKALGYKGRQKMGNRGMTRNELLRLAHQNPELRTALVPKLRRASRDRVDAQFWVSVRDVENVSVKEYEDPNQGTSHREGALRVVGILHVQPKGYIWTMDTPFDALLQLDEHGPSGTLVFSTKSKNGRDQMIVTAIMESNRTEDNILRLLGRVTFVPYMK